MVSGLVFSMPWKPRLCILGENGGGWTQHRLSANLKLNGRVYTWVPQSRVISFTLQYHKGELRLYDVTFENAGMYQCIAENAYGSIYANAELKILGQYPFQFLKNVYQTNCI